VSPETGDLPNERHTFPWRVLDRILHPIARRRRTAAHRRVLHRQRHTGLVTGMPRDRFELTAHNRKVLGLDRGPPGLGAPGEPAAEDEDTLLEAAHADDAVTDAGDARAVIEAAPDWEAVFGDPAAAPVPAMDELDQLGDAPNPGLNDLGEGDGPSQP
jgi:hypothetical protein